MNIIVNDNGFHTHGALLKRKAYERLKEGGEASVSIELSVNKLIGEPESYAISKTEKGYSIAGSDELGLYHGIGKFLHTASWGEDSFTPSEPTGKTVTPACSFRAVYFAVHLYNWYANAPTEELERYIEDLMLWGYNTIVLIIPVIDIYSYEDELAVNAISKSRSIFKLAKKLGMKVGIIVCVNQGLRGAPAELAADPSFDPIGNVRGNAGMNICPSKEGAVEYLREVWDGMLRQYVDIGLDYILTWPYDEGGCGCADCRPWGAKAYCDLAIKFHEDTLKYYPDHKFILSCWIFDKPDDQGEYSGLYERLKGDMSWVDYIMVDAHGDFPTYPLEHEVIKPIVNFPEISMWKLYPWGGYGATPLPERFHRIWNSAKHILSGGMPYSEGMYEDISKVQVAAYYWEPDRDVWDIMKEYINFEFPSECVEETIEIIKGLEKNHTLVGEYNEPDVETALRVGRLARKVEDKLPLWAKTSWRWRIIYIRAILDAKRFFYYREAGMHGKDDLNDVRHCAADFLVEDAESQALIAELRRHYHSSEFNGRNQFTLPFLGGRTVVGGSPMRNPSRVKHIDWKKFN
ncbi:MAG: hypothetical protein E7641_03500 [Ruminococcaceae bacterium]|nr:hypothetical protein [Oscillospiraceae bacterium]